MTGKPTVAFKGAVKVLRGSGTFSAACVTTGAPGGATCQLRVIAGGRVLGSGNESLTAGAARIRVQLRGARLRAARRSATVKFAMDLVTPSGAIVASTRTALDRPLGG